MNLLKHFFYVVLLLVLAACARHAYITTWKAPNITPRSFTKNLVVGVINDSDLTLRRIIEAHLVDDLDHLGYTAVSALAEFGPKGLSNLAQEETYRRLCDQGIDGV